MRTAWSNRIGPALTACALARPAPWMASVGREPRFTWVARSCRCPVLWTATSSALRPFLRCSVAWEARRAAGAVSLALVGIGIAGAIAPVLTKALAQADHALHSALLCPLACYRRAVRQPARKRGARSPAKVEAKRLACAGVFYRRARRGRRVRRSDPHGAAGRAREGRIRLGILVGTGVLDRICAWPGRRAFHRSCCCDYAAVAQEQVGCCWEHSHSLVPQIAADAALFGVAQGAWAVFTAVAVRAAIGGGAGIGSPIGLTLFRARRGFVGARRPDGRGLAGRRLDRLAASGRLCAERDHPAVRTGRRAPGTDLCSEPAAE